MRAPSRQSRGNVQGTLHVINTLRTSGRSCLCALAVSLTIASNRVRSSWARRGTQHSSRLGAPISRSHAGWSRWYLDLHLIDSERSADSAALLQTGADLPFPVASRWCECWRGPPSLLAGVSFARGKKPRQLLGRASSLGSLHPDNKSSGASDQET